MFQTYLNVNKNLFKFTNSIKDLSICFNRKSLINGLQPIGYYDNDFVDNKESFKSTYNYIFKFAESPINWKSKRVSTIILSTLKVETNVLIKRIREVF